MHCKMSSANSTLNWVALVAV